MKIIYNIPNIIRMAGMERILAIKANYLAGLTGMEVVIITYEQKNLPLAFDFSDKIRFYDLDIDYAACRGKNIFWNKIRRIIYTKRHQRRLEEILLKEKPDITISMMTGRERELMMYWWFANPMRCMKSLPSSAQSASVKVALSS